MMKRILLIVSLGVSFVAPAAFGATANKPCLAETGEDSQCQMDKFTGIGTFCDIQQKILSLQSENAGSSTKGSAGAAR